MLLFKHFKVSDEDYGNVAINSQLQVEVQGNIQIIDVAFFHFKHNKFVLDFTGNDVDILELSNKKIHLVDVEDQIHEVKVKQCTGAGDCGQKRFASKTCFNQSIKSVRLVIEM